MKFVSKFKEHRVVLIPDRYIVDNYGRRSLQKGISVEFHNNEYETDDPKIIKLLKETPIYGVHYRGVGDVDPQTDIAKQTGKKENESIEATLTSCPFCPFNAKSAFGLKSHVRFVHGDKVSENI